jgi:hypothetical protein
LIRDVDRQTFAVHLDYINMINCPKRYVFCDDFIEECFTTLGPYIKSIHGKDVLMERAYTTLIHETMPGKGVINYQRWHACAKRSGRIPLICGAPARF